MIYHFHCCPRLFLHNIAELMVRLAAGLEQGQVFANVGGVFISDPDCYITVGVMF